MVNTAACPNMPASCRSLAASTLAHLGPKAKAAHAALLQSLLAPGDNSNTVTYLKAIAGIRVCDDKTREVLLQVTANQEANDDMRRSAWTTLVTIDRSSATTDTLKHALQSGDQQAALGIVSTDDEDLAVDMLANMLENVEFSTHNIRAAVILATDSLTRKRPHSLEHLTTVGKVLERYILLDPKIGQFSVPQTDLRIRNAIQTLADNGEVALPILKELLAVVSKAETPLDERPRGRGSFAGGRGGRSAPTIEAELLRAIARIEMPETSSVR